MAPRDDASSRRARVDSLLGDAAARLARTGVDSARLEAELILARAAGATRAEVISAPLEISAAAAERFEAMLSRRAAREPLAYILGCKEFYSLEFEVTPAVLIPRPETETLVSAALEFAARRPQARVLDIGTGSGAIAIAIAANAPPVSVVATDIDESALGVARRNLARHHLEGRVDLRRADIFELLDRGGALGLFDLIVSNPPYVESAAIDSLEPEVRDFEPRVALFAGADALACYRRIAGGARAHLNDSGAVMLEVGAEQAVAVSAILREAGLHVAGVINDLAGIARVVTARA
ncbi:MAG TPA: peptide chain release factor N(5)-glutamine methyltransferase [Candidatus Binataceae bacterium]|nr:peptide chain release factor N(5)-glutamine methyltransferase [Candidatus Binataceae bacterium]